MAKKVLILSSSPRRGGNSDRLCDRFMAGAQQAGHEVEKIFLKAGESKKVSFKITPELLKFYNYDIQYVYEPGEFHVMIGPNSRDVKTTSFELK